MESHTCHKVCFPVDGKPAINRAIETYNTCGIGNHILVVGVMAGQVLETVGAAFDNVQFAYQAEQRGTAHAARVGLRALSALNADADVLLVPGDRLIEAGVLERLFSTFYASKCDLALVAAPKNEGSGRLVREPDGTLLAIVEVPDIRQRRVYRTIRERMAENRTLPREELLNIVTSGFGTDETKLERAFGELWCGLNRKDFSAPREQLDAWVPEAMTRFTFRRRNGEEWTLSPDEVEEQASHVNVSIYAAKASVLRYGLERLHVNNAQQEEYLTDIVSILSAGKRGKNPRFRMQCVEVKRPDDVLGYNNPAELLEVESAVRARRTRESVASLPESDWFRPIDAWLDAFADPTDPALASDIDRTYGSDDATLQERAAAYREILTHAAGIVPAAEPVFLVRSPGRVNVMGRHVDHQGGHCNLMTIGFETLMVVHPREDDRVRLFNMDPERYGNADFSIGEMVSDLPWDDWLSLVNSEKVLEMVRSYGGHWSQYVRAAVLRLQKKFSHRQLRGMDLIVSGNVPPAAGLSSSSSLVVGAADATIVANGLDTFPAQFVDLCGEGEWFVGTRGGSADHAAVKLGERGAVIKVTFFEFAIEDAVPFPTDYVMMVCDSGIRARKSENARDQFNHRVSCYRIGLRLIRTAFPQYAPLLAHLRDVNTQHLGIPLSRIYRILLRLPELATRRELEAMLPAEDLAPFFATHASFEDTVYPIRGVVLFGLAECERSARYASLLRENRIEAIGHMMNISHDGDRVSFYTPTGDHRPFQAPTSNAYLLNLIEDLESGDPERVLRAQLHRQPGSYHCSLPAIDRMVDIALGTEGAAGAQLAGAGLGGCMMVFVKRAAVDDLRERLTSQYYGPNGHEPRILVCHPIAGAGVLMKPE